MRLKEHLKINCYKKVFGNLSTKLDIKGITIKFALKENEKNTY
jgi:hypothetical protein